MSGIIKLAALVAALTALCPSTASASGVVVEGNAARAQERWGAELGLGYSLDFGGFSLRPIGGAFVYAGDNDRYEVDSFSNGQSRCRDLETGRFADSSLCGDTAVSAYGKVELTFRIPAVAEVGGGVRLSSDRLRGYGTLAFPLAPAVSLKGNIGDRYYAAGLLARF